MPNFLKPSAYNHLINHKEGNYILFNAHTRATITVNQNMVNEVSNLMAASQIDSDTPLIQMLTQAGFLIASDIDEKAIIQQRLKEDRAFKQSLVLTIVPTLGCNFNCPYCFESEASRANFSPMSELVQQRTINFARQFIKNNDAKSMSVTWFGGEPLLAMRVIENLSAALLQLCQELNINYKAHIITNGYKLTPENIDILLAAKVRNAQVTIDGPEHVHNERRILKNGKGSYQKIMQNVVSAIEKGIDIDIRINVDEVNFNDAYILLEDFKRHGLQNKISISLGFIANEYKDEGTKISNMADEKFAEFKFKLLSAAAELGMSSMELPKTLTNYCIADSEGAFIIGPKGEMYQCDDDVGDYSKIVGNICFQVKNNPNYVNQYMEFDPTEHSKCSSCNVMPLCMGGCSKQRLLHDGEPQCGVYKYNLNDWIIAFADKKTTANCSKC